LNPIPVDLNALIVEWKSILELTMGETVRVDLHLGEGLFNVMVDPGQLELSLLNLAINAKHAMPHGGELLIETTKACPDKGLAVASGAAPLGEFVMLTVTDNGLGMSPEVLEQAFDPFFTTKDVGEGSGLGLSMVFGFAKQSGGDVMIESEKGSGTTVRFYLPRAEPAEEPAETTQVPDTRHTKGKIILVIEDEGEVRSVVVNILNTLGFHVLEAESADSALAIMRGTQQIDLVLCDVVLPGGMSGPELARGAQKIWPDLKLLFMSGNAEYTLQQHGLAEGAVLLRKPFMMRDLVREVQAALIPRISDKDPKT
jgi:CheY-like chemotaxis protein